MGDTGDKAKFDAALDKLVASGAFATAAGYRPLCESNRDILGGKEKIVGRLISEMPGEMTIVSRSDDPPIAIAEVDFKGNQVITTTLLRNTIAGVAIGVPYSEIEIPPVAGKQHSPFV